MALWWYDPNNDSSIQRFSHLCDTHQVSKIVQHYNFDTGQIDPSLPLVIMSIYTMHSNLYTGPTSEANLNLLAPILLSVSLNSWTLHSVMIVCCQNPQQQTQAQTSNPPKNIPCSHVPCTPVVAPLMPWLIIHMHELRLFYPYKWWKYHERGSWNKKENSSLKRAKQYPWMKPGGSSKPVKKAYGGIKTACKNTIFIIRQGHAVDRLPKVVNNFPAVEIRSMNWWTLPAISYVNHVWTADLLQRQGVGAK